MEGREWRADVEEKGWLVGWLVGREGGREGSEGCVCGLLHWHKGPGKRRLGGWRGGRGGATCTRK